MLGLGTILGYQIIEEHQDSEGKSSVRYLFLKMEDY